MRIESYTQIQQIYQSQTVSKTAKTEAAKKADQVQISSLGKDIQVAKAAVSSAPDVRSDLTASIKSAIDNGTYEVTAESFADKLMAKLAGI